MAWRGDSSSVATMHVALPCCIVARQVRGSSTVVVGGVAAVSVSSLRGVVANRGATVPIVVVGICAWVGAVAVGDFTAQDGAASFGCCCSASIQAIKGVEHNGPAHDRLGTGQVLEKDCLCPVL